MTVYSRDLAPRNSYYFNLRLSDPKSDLLVEEVGALRDAARLTMERYPFRVDAIAVLPAELLTVWTLPERDTNYEMRWSMLKSKFQRAVEAWDQTYPGSFGLAGPQAWQRRMTIRKLRTRYDFENHCHHVHAAPVTAGLVREPENWPLTSLHREIANEFMHRHARPKVEMRMPWSARNRALRASG